MPDFVPAGKVSDFEEGELKFCRLPGLGEVAVVRAEGAYHAFSNYCTHEGVNLANGYGDVAGETVICLFHNSIFDIASGNVLGGPAYDPLTVFAVKVDGDDVLVGKAESNG